MDSLENIINLALRNSHSGIMLLDINARVCYWNRWLSTHSGYEESDVIGKPLESVFADARLTRLLTAVNNALQHKQSAVLSHSIHPNLLPLFSSYEGKERIPLPHGTVVRPLTTKRGERFCMVQINDISAAHHREQLLKRQSQELKELASRYERQEAHARAIIQNIHDALLTINTEGQICECNTAAAKLFGHQSSKAKGMSVADCFADVNSFDNLSSRVKNQQELTGVRVDGSEFPAEVAMSAVSEGNGDHFVLIVRDLTYRKQAEESLFREKEFAQITLQSIHEAVVTTDRDGTINSANAAACTLLHREQERIIGRPVVEILTFNTLNQRHALKEAMQNALIDGSDCLMEESPELALPDGEVLVINMRISTLSATDGATIGTVLVLQDITLEKRMKEILSYQATHDDLTGLINRREFERRLQESLDRSIIDQVTSSVLYLDLDQFKLINDTCGHDAGDLLLRQLTSQLLTCLRYTDTLARLGGDEFAVLLPGCDAAVGEDIADKLRETVKNFRFNWQGRYFAVGVSIGMVTIDRTHRNIADIMKACDSACYIAKENGRDQVVVYQADGNAEQQRKEEITQAARIRESLEKNHFRLFAQPIVPVNMQADSDWGIEILVRMYDDNNTMVSPAFFIPAAERYNLMSHVDRWVVDAVCREWRSGSTLFRRVDKIAINLSGQSIANTEFLEYVIHEVERNELPWSKICFEITETAAVASIEKAHHFIARLTDMGCRFALDDFGSGLSSFTYLKHLPVNYLKIDGAFVKDMLNDEIDAAMVRSIADIGRSMGLKTIAEFVEDEQVLAALHDAGVHFAQGYGICKPMPLSELEDFTPKVTSKQLTLSA